MTAIAELEQPARGDLFHFDSIVSPILTDRAELLYSSDLSDKISHSYSLDRIAKAMALSGTGINDVADVVQGLITRAEHPDWYVDIGRQVWNLGWEKIQGNTIMVKGLSLGQEVAAFVHTPEFLTEERLRRDARTNSSYGVLTEEEFLDTVSGEELFARQYLHETSGYIKIGEARKNLALPVLLGEYFSMFLDAFEARRANPKDPRIGFKMTGTWEYPNAAFTYTIPEIHGKQIIAGTLHCCGHSVR